MATGLTADREGNTNVLDWWTPLCVNLGDLLVGWLLALPRDLAIIMLGLISVLALRGVRKFTTNQDQLRRADADKAVLKRLVRDAKARGDREAVARHKRVVGMLGLLKLRAEGLPLVVSLPVIGLLATWALHRMEFLPPSGDEPVEIELNAPEIAAGQPVLLVPQDGVRVERGWLRLLDAQREGNDVAAVGVWRVIAAAREAPYELQFRLPAADSTEGFRTIARPLIVGQRIYADAISEHDGGLRTQVKMTQAKLFGVVPGLGDAFFPPWLTAYLLVVIVLMFALKPVLRVY